MAERHEMIIAINGNIYDYDVLLSYLPDCELDYTMQDLYELHHAKSISPMFYKFKLEEIKRRLSNG